MQNDRKIRTGSNRRASGDRRLLFVLIGIAVILLLLIILVVRGNRIRREEIAESESVSLSVAESESVRESIDASLAESMAEAARHTMSECDDPEIRELVKNYFHLRLEADAEGLYRLFGRDTAVTPVDGEFAARLNAQKAWVRSFDDIAIYLLPGDNENEKLGIVTYKINFRRANAKAPCIMYFYAERGEDGSWTLRDDLVKGTREEIAEEFQKSGVQSFIDRNSEELRTALANDSSLALIYTSFMNGEIYSDYNLDPDREQQIDLFTDPQDSVLLGE